MEEALGIVALLGSAVAQPEASFGGEELYPDLVSKAGALGHSLIRNHPFVDGNKRIGHAAIEVFLLLNGHEIDASVNDQEKIIIDVTSGKVSKDRVERVDEQTHGCEK